MVDQKLTAVGYMHMSLQRIMSLPETLIRASVQGIVYLIESASGKVFTYNPENPTYVGQLEKIPEIDKHLISKTNGCLANARVKYREDIRDVMAQLRATVA
jgi:hypothetical protein